ncbi:leucine--tRNA ligase [Patescibacteria group bacterium]|nr:MAG: leucine--tRNA ligase [Patescibacteria group bacterium]
MPKYDPKKIEKKWQKFWEENGTFEVKEDKKKKKFYSLIEFPYPSGEGLHVGHPRAYTAMDIISRKRRMEGYNVLYPIGFDAFGLPTENFAIKTGKPPAEVTKKNISNFTRQLKSLGLSFDWSRQVDTTDPKYYKWTQWIFLQLFKHGLAYKKAMPINWCPSCKIGLANEEVVDGKCERCGTPVERRNKEQWMLAITKYADKLLEGLKEVDYIERAKVQQENWIGRSEGAMIKFVIANEVKQSQTKKGIATSPSAPRNDSVLEVFTTRPDTLFGATYMVVAPEHELVASLLKFPISNFQFPNIDEVKKYVESAKKKSDLERTELQKEKTGVELKGIKAINPATGKEIPVWVADYVLAGYGTGAIMAVPAHDERDSEFAKKFNLPIKEIVPEPMEKIMKWLEEKKIGEKKVQYKLRDWVFSRQRYWGEPIPLVFCPACEKQAEFPISNFQFPNDGERLNPGWIPLAEEDLPLELPKVKKYEPTDTGESPLAAMEKWVKTKCPKCGGPARRETDTMPNWAGSSWYFLRYCDPKNDKKLASMEKLKYWLCPPKPAKPGEGGVDWYNGGMEHTVLHLLYSRFWNQFLFDIGAVPTREPYKKRTSHGMILAKGGEKMSKSKGNVVNPDEMVEKFGADSLRTYIMFMGPFDQAVEWDTNGLIGVRRFLERVWGLNVIASEAKQSQTKKGIATSPSAPRNDSMTQLLHQTIKKVTEDIEAMRFNTAIAKMMELSNEFSKQAKISIANFELFVKILSPFAPHMCEELWSLLGHKKSITFEPWPKYDPELAKEKEITLAVQVNGKLRDTLEVVAGISEEEAKSRALASEKIQRWLEGKQPKKVIYVKGKLVSIVV